jgi:hypothetical protein
VIDGERGTKGWGGGREGVTEREEVENRGPALSVLEMERDFAQQLMTSALLA